MNTNQASADPSKTAKATAQVIKRFTFRRLIFLVLGILAGWAAIQIFANRNSDSAQFQKVTPAALTEPQKAEIRRQAWRKIEPHVREADAKMAALSDGCANRIVTFMDERKSGARPFAKELLSLRSKWILTKSHLPWGDPNAHSHYTVAQFQRCIFSEKEVRQEVTSAVAEYNAGVAEIENRMLTRVRLDLVGFPQEVVGRLTEESVLHARFTTALSSVGGGVASGLKMDAAGLGTSLIVGVVVDRVIAAAITRLAVSGSMLGLGAGSALETAGIGLVVMIGVDWVIGKVTDPEGKIAAEVCTSIEDLKRALCNGDAKCPGLRGELAAAGRKRATLQHEALRQTILANR